MPSKKLILISTLLVCFCATKTTFAADLSPTEASQVEQYQAEYTTLRKTEYNIHNLYATKPKLKRKFNAGSLAPAYINDQIAYINYYRGLFGLNPITKNKQSNQNAQKTAAVMAAINANPFINQHGLPYEKRPKNITKTTWKTAQDTSQKANLNFNASNQSAGEVISDLVTDRHNLTGNDTGHRAWILSTRLTSTGVGAAYGTNGYRYSVQKVLNPKDIFRPASKKMVVYPNNGVFPIELLQGNIAWSVYFSDQTIKHTPKIIITDLDTQQSVQATQVKNYHDIGYGNFQTIITYSPGSLPLITGHEYRVDIQGIYQYQFKLFNQAQ